MENQQNNNKEIQNKNNGMKNQRKLTMVVVFAIIALAIIAIITLVFIVNHDNQVSLQVQSFSITDIDSGEMVSDDDSLILAKDYKYSFSIKVINETGDAINTSLLMSFKYTTIKNTEDLSGINMDSFTADESSNVTNVSQSINVDANSELVLNYVIPFFANIPSTNFSVSFELSNYDYTSIEYKRTVIMGQN